MMRKLLKLGMRLLLIVLCLACVLGSVRPLGATAAQEEKQQTLTTKVHYLAYFSSAVIGQMENGTEIKVLKETRDFYRVDCYDVKGYIAKEQILHTEDGRYYVNCQADSPETVVHTYTEHAEALALRHSLLELAKKQLGSRYVYGASRPGAFDCSGLTSYLYAMHGIEIHRSASTQLQDGIIVAKEGLQVGDLIFFRETGERTVVSHVGIYVGNNQIIHSGNGGVAYANLDYDYFARYYYCARRIVNTNGASTAITDTAGFSGTALPAVGARRVA